MAHKGKFEELLKEKDLVVVEEGKDDDRGGVILDIIYNRRSFLVPWLAEAALFLRRHTKNIKESRFISTVDEQRGNDLAGFLDKLKDEGLVLRYERDRFEGPSRFWVSFPEEPERQLFFRSKWAETSFRRLAKSVVRHYLHQTNQAIPYLLRHNVKVAKVGDEKRVLTEIDLLLEIGDRVYVFEVKSGPWIHILQWAKKECLFRSSQARIITCTTYPGIPAEIFEPQILLTLDSFESNLIRLLETDLGVKMPTTRSKEALWEEYEKPFMDCEEDMSMCHIDTRTLAQRLNEDVFHMRGAGCDDGSHLVRGCDGGMYADYDLNAQWD